MGTKNNNEKVPKKKEPNKAVAVIILIGLIIFVLYLSGVFKSERWYKDETKNFIDVHKPGKFSGLLLHYVSTEL